MKLFHLYVLPVLALFFAGCASDPRAPYVTESILSEVPAEPEKAIAEEIEIPELAEGLRLFHGEEEVTMEVLARGLIPEGTLIHVAVPPDALHSDISSALMHLHSMGYLVGVRSVEGSTP